MRKYIYLYIIALTLTLAASCGGGQEGTPASGPDSLYILDQARNAYYERSDFATAKHICRELLAQEAILRDSAALQEIYSLLTLVATAEANDPDALRYATKAERLARYLNLPDEVWRMQAYAANVLIRSGQVDEGRRRLAEATEQLCQRKTFNGLNAYISAVKKQIHDYYNSGQEEQIPPLCQQILSRLDDFLEHQSDYQDLPKHFDADDFSDFTRGQTYMFLTAALADTGHRTEALHWLREAEKTAWSQRINGAQMLLSAYESLAMWDKVDTVCRRLDEWRTDTLNTNYIVELQALAHAAEARGRLTEAFQLKNRIINLQDTIRQRENTERLADLATVYQLQDAQLERQREHAATTRRTIYLYCSLILLTLAIGFALYYHYQRRLLRQRNRALMEQISEAIAYKEKYLEAIKTNPTASPLPTELEAFTDDELFRYLQKAIEEGKLYLDPNFSRQTLIDRFHLSKEQVGTAFVRGSQYTSLADYINNRRLEHACQTLVAHPEMSISDVATVSGFGSASVLSRNFKTKYSVTPTEYRQQKFDNLSVKL